MTHRAAAGDAWLDDVLRWLDVLAERLAQASRDTGRAREQLERCWTDERGREWVERAGLVQRQLDRDATGCAELADRIARAGREQASATSVDADPGTPLVPGGPVLGGTAVRRVDAARGIRVATLSDAEPRSTG